MLLIAILCCAWFAVLYGLYYYIFEGGRNYKNYIFNFVFSLLIAVWGFIIMANDITGKLFGALLFGVIGWFASFIFSAPIRFIPNTKIATTIRVVVCVALACLVFTTNYVDAPEDSIDLPAGESHSCCICGDNATKVYGGDYWCVEHYYMAKTMDGDLSP